jgi:formamidase
MAPTLIKCDPKILPWDQETPLHNRWHPDIPPVASCKQGEVFRVETVDWTGGQIKNDDSADDVKNVDLNQVHYLSGPIAIGEKKIGWLLVLLVMLKSVPSHSCLAGTTTTTTTTTTMHQSPTMAQMAQNREIS